jgi:hypothetical protein
MAHPVCPKCLQTIWPGTEVDVITDVDMEERRIFTDDDMIVAHLECPPAADGLKFLQLLQKVPPQHMTLPLVVVTKMHTQLNEMGDELLVQWLNAQWANPHATPDYVVPWPDDNPEFLVLFVNEGLVSAVERRIVELNDEGTT